MAQHFQVVWRKGRKFLSLPNLDKYPATPVAYYEGYYPGSKEVLANRVSFKTRIQGLPELNSYPIAISVPSLPAYLNSETFYTKYKTTLQQPLELNTYPVTSIIPFQATILDRVNRISYKVKLQELTHSEFPATSQEYYTGYYPGFEKTKTNKVQFKIQHQVLPSISYSIVAPVFSGYPSYVGPVTNRIKTKQTLQKLADLNSYPRASVPFSSYLAPTTHRTKYKTKLQKLAELNFYPKTSLDYYSGFYPGSALVSSNKISYKTRLQKLLELNRYSPTLVTADLPAWLTHFERTRNVTNSKLKTVELNSYPATLLAYYEGYYPGSKGVSSNRLFGKLKLQSLQELAYYAVTPPIVSDITATIVPFIKTRNNTNSSLKYLAPEAALYTLWGLVDGKTSFSIKENYGSVILYPKGINYFTLEDYAAGLEGEIQYRGDDGQFESDSGFSWNKNQKILEVSGKISINGIVTIYNADAQQEITGSLFVGNGGTKIIPTGINGQWNTSTGIGALEDITTGIFNNASGFGALHKVTTGNSNNAQGAYAARDITIGSYNVVQGSIALFSNRYGNYNVAIGNYAGQGVFESSDINGNTLVGYQAGKDLLTGGDYNTLLGFKAGDTITIGVRNIVIGTDIDVPSGIGDYQLNIGDLIKGEMGATKKINISGGTPEAPGTGYTTFLNLTPDTTCDADATTVEELADILGTLIEDLKKVGVIKS